MTPPLSGGSAPATPEADGLLPCPFCGGEAKIEAYRAGYHPLWQVSCCNEECAAEFRGCHDEAQARTVWNTRAPSASAEGLVEALRNLTDRHFLDGGSLTEPAYLAARAALARAAGK